MTTEEKNRIANLRKAGIGYAKIAQELGISKNTVKTYCRRNGMAGVAEEAAAELPVPEVTHKACRLCGRMFIQYPGNREKKFCSDAQEESRSISDNVKWGIRKRMQKGIPYASGHFRVYGYRWEGDDLVIVPEEAEVVRRIFQNFLDGKSRLETEREFAAEGITTRAGCRWVDSNIRKVLENTIYTGDMLMQKEYIADPILKGRRKNKGELPMYLVEDTHEAIIDKETFQYVQDEMERRRALGPLANKSLNITCFTGKIKCEKCGQSLMRNTRVNRAKHSERGDRLISWVCGSRKKKGGHCSTKEIPDRYLRQACTEAMGMDEFDEDAFVEKVDSISVPDNGVLRFHFKDGTEKFQTWVNTAKKEAWTPEARRRASEYRREHAAMGKRGASCFTSKIKCQCCGSNFRRQSQKNVSCGGKVSYFRCTSGSGCGTPGLREDHLKGLICKVLGIDKFDEQAFLERIDRILVDAPDRLTFVMADNHEAIIDPEQFDRVQDIIKSRSSKGRYSGVTIFSTKVKCGCCGSWYGSKVWHSNDKYRRVVYQCNSKFKDGTHCKTPHLTENEIKDCFVTLVNRLITDKGAILRELKEIQKTLTDTAELEAEQKMLAERMNVDADAVQELIAENARVAQDQDEYNIRYEALASRFEQSKARYEQVSAEITMMGIRRREFGRFITSLEALPEMVTEFYEELWGSLVDHMTVYGKGDIGFTLTNDEEIRI